MSSYKKISFFENRKRIQTLIAYRNLVIKYFNSNQTDTEARLKINLIMREIRNIILYAGINPLLTYTPPPLVGGYIQRIDLVLNIFILQDFQIPPQNLLDVVEQAIDIYKSNTISALIRLFNPFFYLGIIFNLLAQVPFVLIENAGFNRQKAEESIGGRLIKGFVYIMSSIVTMVTSVLTILHLLGYLEPTKEMLKRVLNK